MNQELFPEEKRYTIDYLCDRYPHCSKTHTATIKARQTIDEVLRDFITNDPYQSRVIGIREIRYGV